MPATGSTISTFQNFLKHNYDGENVERLVAEESPHLAKLLQNVKKYGGDAWIVPLLDQDPQGHGATLAKAQAGATQAGSGSNVTGAQWSISWGDYSDVVNIGDKVIDCSASDVMAFFENKKEEIDGLYREFGRIMGSYSLRDSGHSLGKFTLGASGACTMANGSDVVNIAVGQILVVSANDGTDPSHVLIAGSAVGYVVAVNYNAGTFTVSATSGGAGGTPTNWTGTMYAFRDGDFGGDTSPNRIIMGYGSWCPVTDPGSTTFEGVNRAINVAARSGVRLTAAECAGLGIEARIKKLHTRMSSRGWGSPKDGVLHPEKWQQLADSLEARGHRPIDGKIGEFSFSKIELATPGGTVSIWSDRYMPIDAYYAPDYGTIRLATPTGRAGFPKIVNGDGLTMLRQASANAYEFRLACYPGYCHRAPGRCGRCPV